MMRNPLTILFAIALLACALSPNADGQATQGSIFGTITDSSGATVPGAKITIKGVERGTIRTTTTDTAGGYVVNNVDLGSYVVTVQSTGFKTATNPPIEMTVKARVQVDTVLEVGNVTESVEVTSTAPIIKTGTAEVNNNITRSMIESLPVMGRNVMSLAALTPGANGGTSGGRQRGLSGAAVVIGGAPAEGNNFIIEGVSNNMEFSGTLSVTPAMDAVQEFAVQTSQYSAEFGRSSGGVVNIALKSGSNEWHGFAYDYLQNDIFNARPKDFTGANPPKTPLRRHQYGFGGGGRIIRDRVFWFANYEGMRNPSSAYSQLIVPTSMEKTGNFSLSKFNIYDPTTTRPDPAKPGSYIRDQFAGNVIPSSRLSPVGLALAKYFPDPNFTSPNQAIRNNYLFRRNAGNESDQFNIKGNVNLTSKDSLAMHESYQKRYMWTEGWMPDNRISSKSNLDGNNAGLTYTRVVSANIVNEARASYNRSDIPTVLLNNENILDKFNIPGWITNDFGRGFPSVGITNLSAPTPERQLPFGPPFRLTENTYQLVDTMSWVRGRHSLRLGGGADDTRLSRYQARTGGGALTFTGTYTTARPGDSTSVPRTGLPDMLVGVSSRLMTQYGFDAVRIRSYRYNAFIQDDWRVTSKVTLNLGLRYDHFRPWNEEQDRLSNFDLSTGIRLVPESTRRIMTDVLKLPNGDLPPGFKYVPLDQIVPHANKANFAPRLGLAYAPTSKLAFRGGWGLFYSVTTSNSFNNAGTEGNPFFFDFPIDGDALNPLLLSNGLPGGAGKLYTTLDSPAFSAYYGPLDRKDPRAQKYTATIEYSPWLNTALSVGYVGQRTFDHPTLVGGNTPKVLDSTPLASRQIYPKVGFFWMYVTDCDSNFNSMIITWNQRYTRGFTVQSNFTFSKALGYNTGGDQTLTNRWNPRYDYGPLDYDLTRRWVSAVTYQQPKLSSFPAIARAVLGGWAASGILTIQSGIPFTVTANSVLNAGTVGGIPNRANVVGDPKLSSGERTTNRWFNTSAFVAPPAYTWGNGGKNILRGPGLRNLDFALQKSFPVFREGHRITFRMEATNAFNNVHLGNPGSNRSSANFGVITGLQAGARAMQGALRYDF